MLDSFSNFCIWASIEFFIYWLLYWYSRTCIEGVKSRKCDALKAIWNPFAFLIIGFCVIAILIPRFWSARTGFGRIMLRFIVISFLSATFRLSFTYLLLHIVNPFEMIEKNIRWWKVVSTLDILTHRHSIRF